MIIDVQESDAKRSLTVIDSWVEPQTDLLQVKPSEFRSLNLHSIFHHTFSGLLRISWDRICDVFHGLYLSWDPTMFQKSLSFHG